MAVSFSPVAQELEQMTEALEAELRASQRVNARLQLEMAERKQVSASRWGNGIVWQPRRRRT